MKVTLENGELIIRIPVNSQPVPSASGKTLVVASTHGNQRSGVQVNGKDVTIGVNAYIYR